MRIDSDTQISDSNSDTESYIVDNEHVTDSSSSEVSDADTHIDVDFDFFAPRDSDFHAIKRLLTSLFSTDFEQITALSEIVDLILAQPHIGSSVKVDGEEGDPYAIITALDLAKHCDTECVKQLKSLLLKKSQKNISAYKKMRQVFSSPSTTSKVCWIISERLLNVPPQIAPQLYKILSSEIDNSFLKDHQHDYFEYYLFISKVYREVESTVDEGTNSRKRQKVSTTSDKIKENCYFYQAEEEVLQEFADLEFTYTPKQVAISRESDAMRVFGDCGIEAERRVYLIPAIKFSDMIVRMDLFVNGNNK